jgi:hypothetical protein
MSRTIRLISFAVLVLGLAMPAWGVIYNVQENQNLYGHLSQNDPSVVPAAIRNVACVPVAVANSLTYLENKYPGTYNRKLIPEIAPPNGQIDLAEIGSVASILAGPNYMNTKVLTGGTWQDMAIYGKHKYIEQVAPGVTVYAAQMSGTWAWPGRPADETPPIPKPVWVQDNTFPTWQFLYNNLVDREDVEICINEGDWGHCLTLSSFHWDDANNDGIIQQAEGAIIDYIDPATGLLAQSPIFQIQGNNFLSVSYGQFAAATLTMAVKESVPEPATILLLGMSALGLFYMWRRQK